MSKFTLSLLRFQSKHKIQSSVLFKVKINWTAISAHLIHLSKQSRPGTTNFFNLIVLFLGAQTTKIHSEIRLGN